MSQPQIINIPEIFKEFFACRTVLAASHQFPELFEDFIPCRNVLTANHQYPENTQRLFACRTFLAGSHRFPELFKDFFACIIVLAASHQYPGNIQRLFRLQSCLSPMSSVSRKKFEDFFACRIVLTANHQYPGSIQRLFRLQTCLSWKSSVSRNIQRLFRRQSCLSRNSSISRKYSKSFSHAELSQPQIINIPKILKDFFACIIFLAASHQYPGKFQRLFCLQNYLSRKSSISRKYSETYWPAELSYPHVICIPKIFEDFFACRNVFAANHQYPGNIQRRFRLQNCRVSKSSLSRRFKDVLACRIVSAANHQYPEKNSKIFWPVELSQPHVISIPKKFEDFFA